MFEEIHEKWGWLHRKTISIPMQRMETNDEFLQKPKSRRRVVEEYYPQMRLFLGLMRYAIEAAIPLVIHYDEFLLLCPLQDIWQSGCSLFAIQ